MKKILFALSFILLTSCFKDDLPKDYTEENEQEILAYLSEHDLTDLAVKTNSGLYYVIDEEGDGLQPTYQDVVTVAYKGTFTNGKVFDESDEEGILISLQQVIYGWAEGIPYFKEGGSGKLIIPSRLAYGSYDREGIPAGSVLVFDIELLSVNYSKENEKEITDYLSENNLTESAVRTDSGLYYIIKEEGTGETPTDTSIVTVNYKGYFTDEEIFDEKDNKVFNLSSETLIQGWKEGIPYFKEGGKGKLFIPSRLGLKNGSVLIFDIDLITINN